MCAHCVAKIGAIVQIFKMPPNLPGLGRPTSRKRLESRGILQSIDHWRLQDKWQVTSRTPDELFRKSNWVEQQQLNCNSGNQVSALHPPPSLKFKVWLWRWYTADARKIIHLVLSGIDKYGLFGCLKYKEKENDTQNKDMYFQAKKKKTNRRQPSFCTFIFARLKKNWTNWAAQRGLIDPCRGEHTCSSHSQVGFISRFKYIFCRF